MQALIMLLMSSMIFAAGIFVGVRYQEINLSRRERQLAAQRRWVLERARGLDAYHEINRLIWQARGELRREALRTGGLPLPNDPQEED